MSHPKSNEREPLLCLVTGVTGYVGGRLVPELLKEGYRVRVLTRDRSRLQGRPWIDRVEIAEGDVLSPETLPPVMEGVDFAYYLIHSMSGNRDSDFHERDMRAAENFSLEAERQSVRRIIYLGGLGKEDDDLSHHLSSRQLTGKKLRESKVPVTELRAAVIVGSGSISFEMIRYLTERVPIMICPKWVYSRVQPVAIRDVLTYLTKVLKKKETTGKVIEIGGSSVITYAEMMKTYARLSGLKRLLVPVPVLSPALSSYWVHWMTPVPASLARPLIEGLKNDVVVEDDTAGTFFPEVTPIGYEEAVRRAIDRVDAQDVETTWNDAMISSKGDEKPVTLETRQGLIIDRRMRTVDATPQEVFNVYSGLGGDKGWLTFNWAWKLRGMLDRLVGGVGFRRGRRDPHHLRVGDALDFWRVEAIKPGRLLRLRAEMKVPGKAWLEYQSVALKNAEKQEETRLIQTAYFAPKGLAGLLYWYALYPIHALIFSKMIDKIAEETGQAQSTHRVVHGMN